MEKVRVLTKEDKAYLETIYMGEMGPFISKMERAIKRCRYTLVRSDLTTKELKAFDVIKLKGRKWWLYNLTVVSSPCIKRWYTEGIIFDLGSINLDTNKPWKR